MKHDDYKIITKICSQYENYEWEDLVHDNKYYKVVQLPENFQNLSRLYYSEVIRGLIIVVGYYSIPSYYEEDKYSLERENFVAIISDQKNKINQISFISDQMYLKHVMEEFPNGFNNLDNIDAIIKLYDDINRKVNNVDVLYKNFLNE